MAAMIGPSSNLRAASVACAARDFAAAAEGYAAVIVEQQGKGAANIATARERHELAQACWGHLYCAVLAAWCGQPLPPGALAAESEEAVRGWRARTPDPRASWDGFLFPPPTAAGADGVVGADASAASGYMRAAFARALAADARCCSDGAAGLASAAGPSAAETRLRSSRLTARQRDWCLHLAHHFDDIEEYWAHVRSTAPPPGALVATTFGDWCGCECEPRLHAAAGLHGGSRGPRMRCLPPPQPPSSAVATAASDKQRTWQPARDCAVRPKYVPETTGPAPHGGEPMSTASLLSLIVALAVALLSAAVFAISNSERGWKGLPDHLRKPANARGQWAGQWI